MARSRLLATPSCRSASIVRILIDVVRDLGLVAFVRVAAPFVVRERGEEQGLLGAAFAFEERLGAALLAVVVFRQERHRDLARHAQERDARRVLPLGVLGDHLLRFELASERAAEDRRDEADDRDREHHFHQVEAALLHLITPGMPVPPGRPPVPPVIPV